MIPLMFYRRFDIINIYFFAFLQFPFIDHINI